MIDDIPYIIVDNQKISPISRSPEWDSPTGGKKKWKEQTFGVVDRVTISREAREKSQHYKAQPDSDQTTRQALSKRPRTITVPLLTYPPKPRR